VKDVEAAKDAVVGENIESRDSMTCRGPGAGRVGAGGAAPNMGTSGFRRFVGAGGERMLNVS
jgi:hypothetical protein